MPSVWTRIRRTAGVWIKQKDAKRIPDAQHAVSDPVNTDHIVSFRQELFPELIDLILDHLHDDNPSLQACSMVCKAWLVSCQFHLFYELNVPYCTPEADVGFEPFAEFLHKTPSVRGYVHKLTLKADDARATEAQLRAIRKGTAKINPYLLVSICNILPNLHSLRLFMLDWRKEETHGTHPWSCNTDPTQFPSPIRPLRVLAISVIYTSRALTGDPNSTDDMRRIDVLRYFSEVKLMRISRASPTSEILEMHPLKVEKLLLHYIADAPGWIALLNKAQTDKTLRSFGTGVLGLYSPALERTPIAVWLHEDVGPRLEELDLSIVKIYAHTGKSSHIKITFVHILRSFLTAQSVMSRSWKNLGLSTCINLRSLTFSLPLPELRTQGPPTWELVLYIVSNIPCLGLETLHITFESKALDDFSAREVAITLQTYDWEQLAQLRSRFRHLRRPRLSLTHHDAYWHSHQTHNSLFKTAFDTILSEWFE